MYELVYTSTSQGLITGRSGFTTVALTEGFPPNLIASVENLSGYKTLFEHGSEHEQRNPVNFSCQPFRMGRTPYMVLSKISYAGLSYTGRSNVLAHHLIFTVDELDAIPGGAVSVLRAKENFPKWVGDPRMLPLKNKVGRTSLPQGGEMWRRLAGSSRWAAYTAECFRSNPGKSLALAFDPLQIGGEEILELFAETAACLTREELRRFTFSTYCYSSGITNPLFFRSYANDSPLLASIRRLDPNSVICLGAANDLPQTWAEDALPSCEIELGPDDAAAIEPLPPPAIPIRDEDAEPTPDEEFREIPLRPRHSAPAAAPKAAPPPEAVRPEVSPDDAPGRKYVIISLIAVLVLSLCAAVAWRIFSGSQPADPAEPDPGDSPARAERPASSPRPAAPERPASSPRPAAPEMKPLPPPAVEPGPVVPEKPVRPSPEPRPAGLQAFGQLSAQEGFALYRCFYAGGRVPLPKSMRDAAALEVKIRSVGGVRDISDLQGFVAGNRSSSVTVYARRINNTGLMVEWEPDKKNASGQMIFRLVPGGDLEISLPAADSQTVPRSSDVAEIAVFSRSGARCDFKMDHLPAGVDVILNREKKLSAKPGNESVLLLLTASDDLWTFRQFYTISVDGRTLGGINQREIRLHELNLRRVLADLAKRNEFVNQLHAQNEAMQEFDKKNRATLAAPPELSSPRLRKMYADAARAKQLQAAASADDEKTWNLQVKDIRKRLQPEDPAKTLSEDEKAEIRSALALFRKQSLEYAQCRARLDVMRKSIEDCREKIKKQNASLREKLRELSPALFRAVADPLKDVADPQPLDPAFYRKIPEQELLKDIKVEIIRKGNL